MKYLSIFFTFFILSYSLAFADMSSEFRVSSSQVEMGERFTLELKVSSDSFSGEIETNINGLENFDVFSRSQQIQFQSFGGTIKSIVLLQLQLEARTPGRFILGPSMIIIEENEISNDTEFEITVRPHNQILGENIQEIPSYNTNTQGRESNINGNKVSQGPELYGIITENIFIVLIKRYGIFIVILLILSMILSYLLTRINQNQKFKIAKPIGVEESKGDTYEKYFGGLNQNDESKLFIKKYLISSEYYLTEKSYTKQKYTPLTLEEMKQYKNFQHYALRDDFEKLYILYYSGDVLSNIDKQKYIDNLKKYIK